MDRPARCYLDAGAGMPVSESGRTALAAALADGWADPERLHAEGRQARRLLDAARESLADSLGCRPDEVRVTASVTAARQDAVRGLVAARPVAAPRVVASAVEAAALLLATEDTERVPVDGLGRVDLGAWAAALGGDDVVAAVLQQANGEVGTLQPLAAAAVTAAGAGIPLVVDASAALPYLEPPETGDVVVADPRAWGAPPGAGVLVVRRGTRWVVPHPEPGPGEAALPLAVAAAASLEQARREAAAVAARLAGLVDLVRREVPRRVPDVEVVGDAVERLPHVVTFSCLYVDGEPLLAALDEAGFAVGSGSACTASRLEPSHVLAAMGVLTHGNVRLSLHPGVGEADVRRFLDVLPGAVSRVRAHLGVADL